MPETQCHCGAQVVPSSKRTDTYIAVEKLLLYGQDSPEVIQALQQSCALCLESMLHDLEMEHAVLPSDCEFAILEPGTKEYLDVSKRFMESINMSCKVYRIEKNQNPKLLKTYMQHRKPENERLLFHGSRNENYIKILTNGFDATKSKNGSLGYGVYFALNASYSNMYTYSLNVKPETEKEKERDMIIRNILLCRVSLHEAHVGSDIWCIPNDRQAYPEYVIYYVDE